MSAKILKFARPVNGVTVEQMIDNGFFDARAMAVAHGKDISQWFRTKDTLELFYVQAIFLGIEPLINSVDLQNLDVSRLSAKKYSELFPGLVLSSRGSPQAGGGTWLHPDLAIQAAQWCNKFFAIQVSRWVREWLTTGRNPIQISDEDLDREWELHQQRYDIRIELKDFLRPELMNVVVRWAEANGANPRKLCSAVHDAMNERIQGAKAQQIKLMGGLSLAALLRDHFGSAPLTGYAAINKIAKNGIEDRGLEPLQAVHEACDCYLGKAFVPKLVPISENLYTQRRRLRAAKQSKRLAAGIQLDLTLWDSNSEPQVS